MVAMKQIQSAIETNDLLYKQIQVIVRSSTKKRIVCQNRIEACPLGNNSKGERDGYSMLQL